MYCLVEFNFARVTADDVGINLIDSGGHSDPFLRAPGGASVCNLGTWLSLANNCLLWVTDAENLTL